MASVMPTIMIAAPALATAPLTTTTLATAKRRPALVEKGVSRPVEFCAAAGDAVQTSAAATASNRLAERAENVLACIVMG